MKYVFGIDLGTTYSCIAYLDSYGKPVVLKNSDGEHTTPSVVMVETEDNIIVGSEAKRSVEIEPDKTVQFIKRKMGKENDKVILNGTAYSAPEISAYILKKLVQDANDDLRQSGVLQDDESVKDVVITCPAYFGMNERQATKTAGELAGLNVLNIINEPTAAAISYGTAGAGKDETVLVYDLGGGTFDITVMNIKDNEISVICTGGDDTLGGKDWDEMLMDHVVERYQEEYGEDLSEDPETVASLYVDVETWKKSLTAREKINISVNGPAGRLREELTRDQYDEITKNLLNRTKNLLNDVLKVSEANGYPLSRIDKVLLVGGSSRMPQVSKMIERDYKIVPILQDPDEAVAKGAAIFAANEKEYKDFVRQEAKKAGMTVEELTEEDLKNGGKLEKRFAMTAGTGTGGKLAISNVLSRSYGIKSIDVKNNNREVISNILMNNTPLPAKETCQFSTLENNQSGVELEIYETRSTEKTIIIEDQKPITVIEMSFSRAVPKDTPLDVTLALDSSGIMHIMAEEMYSHSKLDTTFSLSNQMTDKEKADASVRALKANVE